MGHCTEKLTQNDNGDYINDVDDDVDVDDGDDDDDVDDDVHDGDDYNGGGGGDDDDFIDVSVLHTLGEKSHLGQNPMKER